MNWISTRGTAPPVSFRDALFAGTAPDGGLYLPERLEPLPDAVLASLAGASMAHIGTEVAAHLLGDELPRTPLTGLMHAALDFPVPLVQLDERTWALELFHGPTLAFKDVGARVMARLTGHFSRGTALTVLVATSGDTGSAVADAFAGAPDVRVLVLYPQGQVSDVQEAQFAGIGGNVTAVAVRGTFDDCQALVKQAFADSSLRRDVHLTPANSINVGRLLPQAFYYFLLQAVTPDVVAVPSGNFGNLTAGLIARRLGARLPRFVAATNVNDIVPSYLRTGRYEPRASVRTVANAMDVGAPSNFERMRALYGGGLDALRADVTGAAFDDATVLETIGAVHRSLGYILDPHGAIGWLGVQQALRAAPAGARGVFLATAHPAKFREVVEPALGCPVPLPPPLAAALGRERRIVPIEADYPSLVELLRS